VLNVNCGFARSNAVRGTKLIEPASAAPGDSGVGELITSTREMLLSDIYSSDTPRFVPPWFPFVMPNPPKVTGV
jgi:hypothetical protein